MLPRDSFVVTSKLFHPTVIFELRQDVAFSVTRAVNLISVRLN